MSFGAGIAVAYARAQQEKLLLTTPRLPSLRRVDAIGLPHNTELVTRVHRRAHPALVRVARIRAALRPRAPRADVARSRHLRARRGSPPFPRPSLEDGYVARLSPWLDPSLVTLRWPGRSPCRSRVVVFTLRGRPVGRGLASALAAHFAVQRRKEFDEPVDGIVYGIVASLGFAAAENIRYFAVGRLDARRSSSRAAS